MRQSGDPQIGPVGPYHHVMPQHHLPPHHMPYHVEQIPTTSHPSWHQAPHPGNPTPPSPYQQHPQQHPQHPPQTVSYPMVQQPHPHPQQHIQQQHHPPLPPQALAAQQQQQQQIQQMQQQRPGNYSTPSPSRGPPPAPTQNQKFRTEQWINNQQPWSYAQSPSTPIVPSVMSYQGADDRMSMLSVNTQMTNQYPESQRCYSSNGSTCENVNPELMQVSVAQMAEQALHLWATTPDTNQRVKFAKAIRDWVREDKFAHVDQATLPKLIQSYLDIIHDGLRTRNPQVPLEYFASLYYYLLDTLRYITALSCNSMNLYLVIQRFASQNGGPHNDFRELVIQFLLPQFLTSQLRPCTGMVFQTLNCIITHMKQEKWRAEFAQSLKFQGHIFRLISYFEPNLPIHIINQYVFTILRFVLSKDTVLKDLLIWNSEPQMEMLPASSIITKLKSVLLRARIHLINEGNQSQEQAQLAMDVIVHTLQLLVILLHNTTTIDAFIKTEGVQVICTVLSTHTQDTARAAFSFLLKISDSPVFGMIQLGQMLPFLLGLISRSDDNEVLYFGTGFLSNVVANKQHVKELAIQNNAIVLLYQTINRIPRLSEVNDPGQRDRFCEILCNCLRTLNNFLLLWVQTSHGARPAGEKEKQHVCHFIEPDLVRKLMSCLSTEGIETPGLMELRSTIIRFFQVLFRTPFVPRANLLNIIDETRNENLVGHICAAYSWVRRQRDDPRTQQTKQQLMERTITVLKVMMEHGNEKQVAESTYSIECPLNLLNDHTKPTFLMTVLFVCDRILEHCPTRADIWSIDRAMLEGLTNHQNGDIAVMARKLVIRLPETNLLADLLSTSGFF